MMARNLETEMQGGQHFSPVDTSELKSQLERKLGHARVEKYFNILARFLNLKMSKTEFDKLCIATIGRENIRLHNYLLRAIIKNASLSKIPPSKLNKIESCSSVKVANGYQRSRSSLQSLCKDFPQSPRRGRTPNLRDRKFKDRPSPLGPYGKGHSAACEDVLTKIQEHQGANELISLASRHPFSVEDGEEVDQSTGSPGIYSRSPLRAPLGISLKTKEERKVLRNRLFSSQCTETCYQSGELPDTSSLMKRLEQELQMQGLQVSADSANLLNNALDIFMKRLIRPCLKLAGSRSGHKHINRLGSSVPGSIPVTYVQKPSVSSLDLQVALDLDPPILGVDWPTQLERIRMHASEEWMGAFSTCSGYGLGTHFPRP